MVSRPSLALVRGDGAPVTIDERVTELETRADRMVNVVNDDRLAVNGDLDTLEGLIAENSGRIDQAAEVFAALSSRVDVLDAKVEKVNEHLGGEIW